MDPWDGSASNPPRDTRPGPFWRAVGFLLAVLGIILVAITPNPPVTLTDWIQVVGGASVTGFLTSYAGWHEVVRLRLRGHGARMLRWLSQRRVAVAVALVLTALLVVGVPPAVDLGRGIASDIWGCPPATQLRMAATPETVTTARALAGAYERWTAADNHDCPTTEVYVYPAAASAIRERVTTEEGWLDEWDRLREVGPQPDLLLAATEHELTGLAAPVAAVTPVATSPVVLAVPQSLVEQKVDRQATWAELFRRLVGSNVAVIRAAPDSSELGMLATTLLYGLSEPGSAASPQQLAPAEIERYIASSLDRAGFPPTDTAGLLCRLRGLGGTAAVLASEQLVVRFNLGDPLGPFCPSREEHPERLVALYPSDTRSLDHQLVRFSWSGPRQEQAAAEFAAWLSSAAGRDAIARTGLRPLGPYPIGAGPTEGIDPAAVPSAEPVAVDRWDATAVAYEQAQRRGRVLFAVDSSGSMGAATPEGTRWTTVSSAVANVLSGMGPRDEFGLWFFPDEPGTGHVSAVPLGPPQEARKSAAEQALNGVRPAGNTPLFRTMIDAASALGSADDPAEINAVVVLTDGEDTSSGLGPEAVSAALVGRGVRLVVITIGEVSCADAGLRMVTTATAGECLDADLTTLNTVLATALAALWGGR